LEDNFNDTLHVIINNQTKTKYNNHWIVDKQKNKTLTIKTQARERTQVRDTNDENTTQTLDCKTQ